MNMKTAFLALFIVGVFLTGCSSGQNYQSYDQQGQQQDGQYVGSGCGVAPGGSYEETPLPSNPATEA